MIALGYKAVATEFASADNPLAKVVALLLCIGASTTIYKFIARPSRTANKAIQMPVLGSYCFVVPESEEIYAFPLLPAPIASDSVTNLRLQGTDFACATAMRLRIGSNNAQVLKQGKRIEIAIAPNTTPLVFQFHIHNVNFPHNLPKDAAGCFDAYSSCETKKPDKSTA